MKQVLVLCVMIGAGTVTAVVHPFFGILPYYVLAVLRPQSLWDWALPDGVRWSLYAAAGAVLGVILSLPRVMSRMEWNRVTVLIVLFGSMVMISCVNAMHSGVAGQWAQEYLKIFVMAGIATMVIETFSHLRYLTWMMVATIGYLAWEFNSRYIFDGRLDIFTHGHGGWDNNGVGLLIAMGLPFAYWLGMAHRSMWFKAGAVFLGLLMIHAVMLSYSRGAMVAAIVGLGWLGWNHRPRWHTAAAVLPLVVAVLFLAGPEIRDEFVSISSYHEDASAQSRFDSWSAAWQIAWDHPLTGVGVRNGNLFSQAYGADMFGRTIHNQYLQVAADNGIPAASVYLLLCFTAWWCVRRTRKRLYAEAGIIEQESDGDPESEELDRADQMRSAAVMALAFETGMMVFFFGGLFLSLETFEIAWLLFVLAGSMPRIAERHFDIPILGNPADFTMTRRMPPPLLLRRPAITRY